MPSRWIVARQDSSSLACGANDGDRRAQGTRLVVCNRHAKAKPQLFPHVLDDGTWRPPPGRVVVNLPSSKTRGQDSPTGDPPPRRRLRHPLTPFPEGEYNAETQSRRDAGLLVPGWHRSGLRPELRHETAREPRAPRCTHCGHKIPPQCSPCLRGAPFSSLTRTSRPSPAPTGSAPSTRRAHPTRPPRRASQPTREARRNGAAAAAAAPCARLPPSCVE